jgi:hypothetical protein
MNYKIVSKSVHTPPGPYISRIHNIYQDTEKNSEYGINRNILKILSYFDKTTLYTRTPSNIEILNIVTIKNTLAD